MKPIHGTKETIYYAEHFGTGHIIYPTQLPQALQPLGYVLKSTSNPKEMDRIFRKMHDQEREHNEKFVERLYHQGRERFEMVRATLKGRLLASDVSNAERDVIKECLRLMDENDHKMQQNNVYGVSAMEEFEAPLEGPRTKVTIN